MRIMLKVGDKVVMNRDNEVYKKFMKNRKLNQFQWWLEMEEAEPLIISDILTNNYRKEGVFDLAFENTEYLASSEWVKPYE